MPPSPVRFLPPVSRLLVFSDIRQALRDLLQGNVPPEGRRELLSVMKDTLVRGRLDSTHWKRRMPTVAMLSDTAIGEFYLRPVDY